MIPLDSNVLVRYLAQDDVIQSARATRLIEDELSEFERGFVTLIAWSRPVGSSSALQGRRGRVAPGRLRPLRFDSLRWRLAKTSKALSRLSGKRGDFADARIT